MPYITNPIEEAQSFDAVEIGSIEYGGSELAGLAIVTGFKRPFGWDTKKGKGVKGAVQTLNEFPPATGKCTFVMWMQEHFELLEMILDGFDYDPVKRKSSPLDFFHPSTAARGVTSVICKSIGQYEHKGKGRWECEVELEEYLPPPKKDSSDTANGSKTKTSPNKPGAGDDPIADEQQRRIAKLLKEAKE